VTFIWFRAVRLKDRKNSKNNIVIIFRDFMAMML